MTQHNEIKTKADRLIHIVNRQAITSLEAFSTRFPEVKQMMESKTDDDWVFCMTIGGTAAAVMMNRQLTGEESTAIVRSLADWNSDATEALDQLLGYIDKNAQSGVDHFTTLGLWILKNIDNEKPLAEEATLAPVIGLFLRDSFKGAWDSN